jgi:serine/threonine protein kinase
LAASADLGSSAEERLPKKIGGKYRPIRVLGRGGMSVVYEVEHELTRDRLALKVLKRSLDRVGLARFKREARISTLMKSPHVVRVLDADIAAELQGAPFLVMDLLRGADLAAVSARRPQPPDTVVDWLRQAARAIDLGHQLGVVHRDLKPENLFLTQSDTAEPLVKVLDFGVARISVIDETLGTKAGSLVGTPLFMSPEQATGAVVGPAADVWSMGMCAFRLLSGRDYWEAGNVTLLLAKIVYEPVLRPSHGGLDLGTAFDEWFLRSCARNPGERWESVGRQIEELAGALGCTVCAVVAVDTPQRTPMAFSDDFTISRVGEDDGSLDPAATSAEPTPTRRPLRPLALAVSLAAALGGSLLLGSRLLSPHEEAPTSQQRRSAPPAPITIAPPGVHPAAVEEGEIRKLATDTRAVEPKDEARAPSRMPAGKQGAAVLSVPAQAKAVERRTRAAQRPASTLAAPETLPQVSATVAPPPAAAPLRDPLADPD